MTTTILTDRVIRSLSVSSGTQDFRDPNFRGFGIRVNAGGSKSFFVMYRFRGRRKRYHLGRYPTVSLARARAKAREALVQVDNGHDPQAERIQKRQAETFEELFALFLELYARPRHSPLWFREQQRVMDRDVFPILGKVPASEITKRDIVEVLDRIHLRAPVMANRTRSMLSKIFRWAVARDLIEFNPVAGVENPGKEQSRERVLTDNELRAIWMAAHEYRASPFVGDMVKLLILTAQRGGEIRSMRWADIERRSGWWTIPRTKNGKSHRVYLSEQAMAVLGELDPRSGYVFPSERGAMGHMTKPYKGVRRMEQIAAGYGATEPWVLHDLRRTAATMMAGKLKVPPFVIERILGHTDQRITAVYDRASYDDDKRQAMIRWGKWVEELVSSSS